MRYLFIFLTALFVTPLAQAQKPDEAKPDESSLFGTWEYTVRPEDPMAQGTFVLEEARSQVNGTFNTDGPRKMENIELTDSSLSFLFTQPGMGEIAIVFSLESGELVGTATLEGQEEPLPIVAARGGIDGQTDSSEN